jgi:hypothetical protein
MMATEIIALAKSLILQGDVDPMWSSTQWHLYFCEAVEILHEAIVAADLDMFVTRDITLTLVGEAYALPDDLYAVKWVTDSDGDPIHPVDHTEEKRDEWSGYTLADESLIIVNYDDPPATLLIDYVRLPKEIDAWTSSTAPTSAEDIAAQTPDWPLSTSRGGRVLARIMQHLAKADDDNSSQIQMSLAKSAADRFVDRLLSRKQFE